MLIALAAFRDLESYVASLPPRPRRLAVPIVDEVRSIRQAGMCGESHVTRLPCVRTQLRAEWRKLARLHGDPHGTVWHHPDVQLLARAKLLKARSRFAPRSRARGACFS